MKKILPIIYISLNFFSFAQTTNWKWTKSAGWTEAGLGNSVCPDSAGNVYVAGSFSSPTMNFGSATIVNNSAGTNDIYLAKYDFAGSLIGV